MSVNTPRNVPLNNPDFENSKERLKEFLKNQDRFKDYDFEGSNMSVLLDVLAYNTYYNNVYNNMALSETFLDSAKLKNSVISRAKELNYLPKSVSSAEAVVDLILSVNGNPSSITVPRKTKFNAKCGNLNYTFTNDRSVKISPDSSGRYIYKNLIIKEGKWKTEFYNVGQDEFILSSDKIDISSIRLFVRDNANNTSNRREFLYKSDIFGVYPLDMVFYLEPYFENNYKVIFGKDKFGLEPINGNVIEIEYRESNGDDGNNLDQFTLSESIMGYSGSTKTVRKSYGGSPREDIESIKFFAPKSIQIQERATSERDYEILLKRRFPEIRAVSAYGGEKENPPRYGSVIITVDVDGAEDGFISETAKNSYHSFLKDKTMFDPIIKPASFLSVKVNTIVNFDFDKSNEEYVDIENLVTNTIVKFSSDNLENFNKDLRYSKLTTEIDKSHDYIKSNETEIGLSIDFFPMGKDAGVFYSTFGNTLKRGGSEKAVTSSQFTLNGNFVRIEDNGNGSLDIVRQDGDEQFVVSRNIGSVDYDSGNIEIRNLNVPELTVFDSIAIDGNVKEKDILGVNNKIMRIRPQNIRVTIE